MKQLKVYLIVMGLLLLGALAAGVYVWYTVQTMNRDLDTVYQALEERVDKQKQIRAESVASSSTTDSPNAVFGTEVAEVTLPPLRAETLTAEERTRLESFGVGTEMAAITPAMLDCASGVVGEERLREIVKGSAPSPVELEALLRCLKK